MLHCDLRVWWTVTSDLQFRAAISEPEARPFCGISGGLTLSTRKLLAIVIVQFWRANKKKLNCDMQLPNMVALNAVGYRKAQRSVKERKCKRAKECNRPIRQERKRAPLRKTFGPRNYPNYLKLASRIHYSLPLPGATQGRKYSGLPPIPRNPYFYMVFSFSKPTSGQGPAKMTTGKYWRQNRTSNPKIENVSKGGSLWSPTCLFLKPYFCSVFWDTKRKKKPFWPQRCTFCNRPTYQKNLFLQGSTCFRGNAPIMRDDQKYVGPFWGNDPQEGPHDKNRTRTMTEKQALKEELEEAARRQNKED